MSAFFDPFLFFSFLHIYRTYRTKTNGGAGPRATGMATIERIHALPSALVRVRATHASKKKLYTQSGVAQAQQGAHWTEQRMASAEAGAAAEDPGAATGGPLPSVGEGGLAVPFSISGDVLLVRPKVLRGVTGLPSGRVAAEAAGDAGRRGVPAAPLAAARIGPMSVLARKRERSAISDSRCTWRVRKNGRAGARNSGQGYGTGRGGTRLRASVPGRRS